MPFKRFVEAGRVVYVVHGPYRRKLCTIVDIIDQTRVLVDGPCTGVPRHGIRINQISLTKFNIKFPRNGPTCLVSRAWKSSQMDSKWHNSLWAEKLAAKKKRLALSDLDRFRLKGILQRRNKVRTVRFLQLKRSACRRFELHGMKVNPKAKYKKDWEEKEKRMVAIYAKLKERRLKYKKIAEARKREASKLKKAKKVKEVKVVKPKPAKVFKPRKARKATKTTVEPATKSAAKPATKPAPVK